VTNFQLFSGTITANGDTKDGTAVGNRPIPTIFRKSGIFFIKATGVTGTDPTLDVDIITYDPITEAWYVIGSFTQIVADGQEAIYIPEVGEKIAIQYVKGGTSTPTFPIKVGAILRDN